MHITATYKAKQILRRVCFTGAFYGSASPDTLRQLHLSMVQPHLDYACQIWDPHLAKDKKILEDVQKFACRHLTNGILAIRTYFNCINYHPWRNVGCT